VETSGHCRILESLNAEELCEKVNEPMWDMGKPAPFPITILSAPQ